MSITEISLDHTRRQVLINVENTREAIDDMAETLASLAKKKEQYTGGISKIDEIQDVFGSIELPEILKHDLTYAVRNLYDNWGYTLENTDENMRELATRLENAQEDLISLKKDLAKLSDSDKKLILAEFEETMRQYTEYMHNSLKFTSPSSVQFKLHRVVTAPRFNNCSSTPDGYVILDDVNVDFNFSGMIVTLLPANSGEGSYMFSGEHRSIHPHVLRRGSPCFGDFGGPIIEHMNNGDMLAAIDVLMAFLHTTDPSDAAAKHWFKIPITQLGLENRAQIVELDRALNKADAERFGGRANKEFQWVLECRHPEHQGSSQIIIRYEDDEPYWRYIFENENIKRFRNAAFPDFAVEHARIARRKEVQARLEEARMAANMRVLMGPNNKLAALHTYEKAATTPATADIGAFTPPEKPKKKRNRSTTNA